MVKELKFGEDMIRFDDSLSWALAYRAQFGVDPMVKFAPTLRNIVAGGASNSSELAIALICDLGVIGTTEIAWAMAYNANPQTIPYDNWLEKYMDEVSPFDLVNELIADAFMGMFATKNVEAPEKKTGAKKTRTKKTEA